MAIMDSKPRITANRLRKLVHYDPDTGAFTWRLSIRGGIAAGNKAGYIAQDGYLRIGFNHVYYKGHDLAWLYVHGEWPPLSLDHKNRNPAAITLHGEFAVLNYPEEIVTPS